MNELPKFIIVLLLLAGLLFVATRIFAGAIDQETCNALDERLRYDEKLSWIGYPQGWDLPDDLRPLGLFPIEPTNPDVEASAHYGIFESKETKSVYVWYFFDLETDGEPLGQHHICPQVWRIQR